jgi:anti-anti-sigma regulatory factor
MSAVWAVYDASWDRLQEELRDEALAHPEFAPLIESTPRDPAVEAESRRLLEGAMGRGEWAAYWKSIRVTAAQFAQADITFGAWFDLVNSLRGRLVDELFAAHGGDSAALRRTIGALDCWLDQAMGVFGSAFVAANEQVIATQQRAIRALSTPVLQVRPGMLILPIVGTLDRERLDQLTTGLLEGVRGRRARAVVLDVTGVPDIDSMAANELFGAVASARMMGATVIVSGLSAEIAQTLVNAGIDLAQLTSVGDLQSGIEHAERILRDVA